MMRDKFRRMPSWHNFGLQLYIERKQDFVTLLRFIRRPGVKGGINNGTPTVRGAQHLEHGDAESIHYFNKWRGT